MEVVLDTNFLLSCVKQKIDLFEQIESLFPSAELVVPKQVVKELETLKSRKELKLKERESASIALQLIEKNKKKIRILGLEGNADRVIINYALSGENIIAATLDGGIKKHLKNKVKILAIRGKKRIVVI